MMKKPTVINPMLGVLAVAMVIILPAAKAQQPKPTDSFQARVMPLLEHYCADCHMKENSEAGIAFDRYENQAAAIKDGQVWIRVRDALQGRIMPPAEESQPALEERGPDHWLDRK